MISERIDSVVAVVWLIIGGWIAIVDQPPVVAMFAGVIVVAGAVQTWAIRQLGGEARGLSTRSLFLLGAALMLSGW